MRQRFYFFFCLLLAILFASAIATAKRATTMRFAEQAKSPARLIQTTHGADDWLISASLRNESDKTIAAYRIGWAYVLAGKTMFQQGPWMNVPAGIKPGTTYKVPDQNVAPHLDATQTTFFVSEVKFVDGTRWHQAKKEVVGGK